MRLSSSLMFVSLALVACHKPVDNDGDGIAADVDCNDDDATISDGITFFADADADGSGITGDTTSACTVPPGYATTDDDCDDADANVHPGATETDCESKVDANCDGSVGFTDGDGDGFAACNDCNDADKTVNPDASETCDGVDQDCDKAVDDAPTDPDSFYADGDDDGEGAGTAVLACEAPVGTVATNTDCDDDDKAVNHAATEACNAVDDDCDGEINEAGATGETPFYADVDGDTFGDTLDSVLACTTPSGYVANEDDCDDDAVDVFPGADELCNGEDDDCNGLVDDSPLDQSSFYADGDDDGNGAGTATLACTAPNGFSATNTDCDDADATTYVGANELCDGKDNDCLSGIPANETTLRYLDGDKDGYGLSTTSERECAAPSGYAADNTDCDDAKASTHPGALELPGNGVDDDCTGGDPHPTVYNVDRNNGQMWAVERVTGAKLWTATFGRQGIDLTVGPDGTIYVGGYDNGAIYKVNPTTQAVTTLVNPAASLAGLHGLNYDFANNVILATSASAGNVVSVNPSTGALTTLVTGLNQPIDAMRFAGDPRIYITIRSNWTIAMFTPSTGLTTTLLSLPADPNLITGSNAIGKIFTSSAGGAVMEVDLRRKSVRVLSNVLRMTYGSCADPVPGNNLLIGDHASKLWTYNTTTTANAAFSAVLGTTWGCATAQSADYDADGAFSRTVGGADCDDFDAAVHPGLADARGDKIDQNCDGVDGLDADADGSASIASGGKDCDDTNTTIYYGSAGCGTPASCLEILDNSVLAPDGVYNIDPLGTGAVPAYCDMSTEGGGWTRVVNIRGNSIFHADATGAVGNVSVLTNPAKLSDTAINALTTVGYWRYECGNSKSSYVKNASGVWTSMKTNTQLWSMDNDKNGSYECAANRTGYVFSDYIACPTGHSNYAALAGAAEGNGCFTTAQGWNLDGALWAR